MLCVDFRKRRHHFLIARKNALHLRRSPQFHEGIHGNVKCSRGFLRKTHSAFRKVKHFPRHFNRMTASEPVHLPDRAVGNKLAQKSFKPSELRKCRFDRIRGLRLMFASNLNFHKSAHHIPHPANASSVSTQTTRTENHKALQIRGSFSEYRSPSR